MINSCSTVFLLLLMVKKLCPIRKLSACSVNNSDKVRHPGGGGGVSTTEKKK